MRPSGSAAPKVALAVVTALVAACDRQGGAAGGPPGAGGGPGGGRGPAAFPVEVMQVAERPVEFSVDGVGSVEAFETVQVTARVGGVVDRVRFVEGQNAQKGDVLVEIEPQRYQLAVRAAEATLSKVRASLGEAKAGLERREEVNRKNPGLIRGEELETFRTRAQTAASELAEAQVALEQAQLNLRDAYVKAPVDGTLQTRTVQTGQYVQPGAVLATLVRRDPLLLRFQVPEGDAARLAVGGQVRFRVGGGQERYEAKIVHVAAQANPTSRMVPVNAEITDQRADELRPGQFAEVTVPVGSITAPVIPQTAIRPSERGFLAFVVEDGKAQERVVSLGMRTPDGRVEVREGIRPGEVLVVRGGEALRDGAPVRIAKEGDAPAGAPPGAPRGQRPDAAAAPAQGRGG